MQTQRREAARDPQLGPVFFGFYRGNRCRHTMLGNDHPNIFRYTAGPEDRGHTLEEVLRRAGLSGRRIRRLARERKIRVNGRPSFLAKPMKPGDRVEVDLREAVRRVPGGSPGPSGVSGIHTKASGAPAGGNQVSAGTHQVSTGTPQLPAGTPPVPILYEDEWLLVVNKPAGIAVHLPDKPGLAGRVPALTLADLLRRWGAEASPPWVPHLVHRLDRDTAGVLLVAKSAHVHARLDAALREGRIHRTYAALVEGDARDLPEYIDLPLAPDPRRPGRFLAASRYLSPQAGSRAVPVSIRDPAQEPGPGSGLGAGGTLSQEPNRQTESAGGNPQAAKPAATRILRTVFIPDGRPTMGSRSTSPVPESSPPNSPRGVTFVEMELETGRTHQIRVHLSALGHPVLGDRWYRSRHPGLSLMLFARRIVFPHPSDGRLAEVSAPFPEAWRPWLASVPGESDERRPGITQFPAVWSKSHT
ncbi:RluA family pseudouridine synthase [Kyrpidia spormannii]|uniref:RluA family pseudouridine synthase n=1 Tax=Kyrpidia spormannii TaxID=2055160 RepID=UPI001054FDD7|nr:RluA family pseudouridine synthase [Kyrpidia spormannii]